MPGRVPWPGKLHHSPLAPESDPPPTCRRRGRTPWLGSSLRCRSTTVVPDPGMAEAELLSLAASLERSSEHPLAAAIVAARRRPMRPSWRRATSSPSPARASQARRAPPNRPGQRRADAAGTGATAGLEGIVTWRTPGFMMRHAAGGYRLHRPTAVTRHGTFIGGRPRLLLRQRIFTPRLVRSAAQTWRAGMRERAEAAYA